MATLFSTEYSVVLPDGSLRRLLGRGKTVRNADGAVVRMVGVSMDVTARYEAEMARDRLISVLETERSRLATIIASLPVGVGIVDDSGHVVLGNETMRRFAGDMLPSSDWRRVKSGSATIRTAVRLDPADYPGARALLG